MDAKNPPTETSSDSTGVVPAGVKEESSPRDVRAQVAAMVAAGEWPTPASMESIVAAGEHAVEPLAEVLRSEARGWPAEAPLSHAIGLLSEIRSPRVIPTLVDFLRRDRGEMGNLAVEALADLGDEGFGTLLELVLDPSIVGYQKSQVTSSARLAAGDDPGKKPRLAEALRELLSRFVASARDQRALEADQSYSPRRPRVDPDDDDAMNAIPPVEELSFLIDELCHLADPDSRELIQAAFDEGLVDTSIVDVEGFKEDYEKGGRPALQSTSWLEEYRALHANELERRRDLARMGPIEFPSRSSYPTFSPAKTEPWPPPEPSVGPIRNSSAKIGRNDPCWCGSGKKYKKCHMGKDAPA